MLHCVHLFDCPGKWQWLCFDQVRTALWFCMAVKYLHILPATCYLNSFKVGLYVTQSFSLVSCGPARWKERRWLRGGTTAAVRGGSGAVSSSSRALWYPFMHSIPSSLFLRSLSLGLLRRVLSPLLISFLLWLPVSSWPGAQPPLGSIPHREPAGREGWREGERERESREGEGQMEGMRERTTAGLLI